MKIQHLCETCIYAERFYWMINGEPFEYDFGKGDCEFGRHYFGVELGNEFADEYDPDPEQIRVEHADGRDFSGYLAKYSDGFVMTHDWNLLGAVLLCPKYKTGFMNWRTGEVFDEHDYLEWLRKEQAKERRI